MRSFLSHTLIVSLFLFNCDLALALHCSKILQVGSKILGMGATAVVVRNDGLAKKYYISPGHYLSHTFIPERHKAETGYEAAVYESEILEALRALIANSGTGNIFKVPRASSVIKLSSLPDEISSYLDFEYRQRQKNATYRITYPIRTYPPFGVLSKQYVEGITVNKFIDDNSSVETGLPNRELFDFLVKFEEGVLKIFEYLNSGQTDFELIGGHSANNFDRGFYYTFKNARQEEFIERFSLRFRWRNSSSERPLFIGIGFNSNSILDDQGFLNIIDPY